MSKEIEINRDIKELMELRERVYKETLEENKHDSEVTEHLQREYNKRTNEEVADELYDKLLDSLGS
jgi:hypothetical protein